MPLTALPRRFVGLVVVLSLLPLWTGCAAMGKRPEGARLARMQRSPQWHDGAFENPQPLWNNNSLDSLIELIRTGSPDSAPSDAEAQIPVVRHDGRLFDEPPPTGLRVTWFGHSSLLVEIDGTKLLLDPVWGERTSPASGIGPSRWYPPPVALEDLPAVDAVIISHDHYDHLDHATFEVLATWDTRFFVPLGVGAHLEHWGVPPERIVELDWWERGRLGHVEIVCTPSRHASGRGIFDWNSTLWAGWAFLGPRHRVFFSGDTGLFDGMKEIGERLGPFDLTMIEVGAYNANWPDWHLGPEQAVLAHQWLQGEMMLPVHWGLFDLAFHAWTEPAERTLTAARQADIRIVFPFPGQSVEPQNPPRFRRWWPTVPHETAEQHPVVATDANGRPPKEPPED